MDANATGTWLVFSSTAWGAGTAWLAVCVLSAVARTKEAQGVLSQFEEERRRRLRASGSSYARLEPLIIPLAVWNAGRFDRLRKWTLRSLVAAGRPDWTAEEFLAVKQIEGFASALAGAILIGWWQDTWMGFLSGGLLGFALAFGAGLSSLRSSAAERRAAIAVRLPYAVDLVALILEAGGHFLDALSTLVQEMENHPLADELGQVHRSIRLGIPRDEALKALGDRVGLPALAELVATIIQGEAGGTPLAEIFRVQAEQMRIKRSQAIEKATAQANVHMVYPGLISMLACILIMGSQFVIWMMATNQ